MTERPELADKSILNDLVTFVEHERDVQSVGEDREPDHRQQRGVTHRDRSSGANTTDGRRLGAIEIVVAVEIRDREFNRCRPRSDRLRRCS